MSHVELWTSRRAQGCRRRVHRYVMLLALPPPPRARTVVSPRSSSVLLPQGIEMETLRKHWLPITAVAVLLVVTVAWMKWPSSASAADASLTAPVKYGDLKV